MFILSDMLTRTDYNREARIINIAKWGNTATSYMVIDDIFAGTVHRNGTPPVIKLFKVLERRVSQLCLVGI